MPPEPLDDPGPGAAGPAPGAFEGRLLVAVPGVLEDPNFRRTVVLVLDHGPHGALGVVLNRPTDRPVTEHFPGWDQVAPDPAVVFEGGPVSPSALIALGRRHPGWDDVGWSSVVGLGADELGTVDITRSPDDLRDGIEALRLFVGYAGWRPAQLEGEVEVGAWFVVPAEPTDPFSPDPEALWRAVLRRQRARVAMYANYPEDVTAN